MIKISYTISSICFKENRRSSINFNFSFLFKKSYTHLKNEKFHKKTKIDERYASCGLKNAFYIKSRN
jgi:hypothetical protein